MHPVAVLEALEELGYPADALEAIGQRIFAMDSVTVAELAAAGLAGRDIIAVRRAMDPTVCVLQALSSVFVRRCFVACGSPLCCRLD